jgi:ABC-type multidrug transport system permease subunit
MDKKIYHLNLKQIIALVIAGVQIGGSFVLFFLGTNDFLNRSIVCVLMILSGTSIILSVMKLTKQSQPAG